MLESGNSPLVWLISGYRAGENTQLLALMEALGWPYERKQLSYRRFEFRTNLFRGSDLRGIRLADSNTLQAPWPDLVVAAGMRNEPVCRWIREQSGGHTKIVHIGRPWADPSRFDLVITTPQYRLPQRPNVLQNLLTLHRVNTKALCAAGGEWEAQLAHLRRPYVAVIVGGNSGPYTLGEHGGARLARQANALAKARGATLLVTSSARTSAAAMDALQQGLDVSSYVYRWQENDPHNPYYAFLALSDALIVTADSISMLSEACATGKPVYMFDIGVGKQSMRGSSSAVGEANDFNLSTFGYRVLIRWGPKRLSRDITLVHKRLINSGNAVWLGDKFPPGSPPALRDIDRAAERVRKLVANGSQP